MFIYDQVIMTEPLQAIVVNSSLRPSRTGVLSNAIRQALSAEGVVVEALDLSLDSMPFCDGTSCYSDSRTIALTQKVAQAQIIVLASPVYNYTLNAAAKNFLELTGAAWTRKVVGIVCNAGSRMSYMAPMNFAQCLMLDQRSRVAPRYVYATAEQIQNGTITDPDIQERIDTLAKDILELAR